MDSVTQVTYAGRPQPVWNSLRQSVSVTATTVTLASAGCIACICTDRRIQVRDDEHTRTHITFVIVTQCNCYSCGKVAFMTLNYQLLNMNLINEILLSVLYFSMYDCAYTDFVLSGCFVILRFYWVLLYDFSAFYSRTAVNVCDWHVYNKLLLTYFTYLLFTSDAVSRVAATSRTVACRRSVTEQLMRHRPSSPERPANS